MTISVEFFGIPRQRAGVACARVEASLLGDVLQTLAASYPQLAQTCLTGQSLRPGYLASINGRQFVADPAVRLNAGDVLMIFSTDAGG